MKQIPKPTLKPIQHFFRCLIFVKIKSSIIADYIRTLVSVLPGSEAGRISDTMISSTKNMNTREGKMGNICSCEFFTFLLFYF